MVMDSMTRRQRSRHMSQIRVSGTQPELAMRKMVKEFTDLPLKYNVKDLVGKPDIVVAGLKLVVFVDGCFWHGCCYCYEGDKGCPHRYSTYINAKGEEVKKPIKFGELYTYTFHINVGL